jgi:hypothetical protein
VKCRETAREQADRATSESQNELWGSRKGPFDIRCKEGPNAATKRVHSSKISCSRVKIALAWLFFGVFVYGSKTGAGNICVNGVVMVMVTCDVTDCMLLRIHSFITILLLRTIVIYKMFKSVVGWHHYLDQMNQNMIESPTP